MNKIQVGLAASPNIAAARSRVGSLANADHRPGGGAVRIEHHRVDLSGAAPRIQARSDHRPGGGNKKVRHGFYAHCTMNMQMSTAERETRTACWCRVYTVHDSGVRAGKRTPPW